MSRGLVLLLLGVVAWGGLAALGAIAIGLTIRQADTQRPSCCPHPGADAPETVRGEFRAVVTR